MYPLNIQDIITVFTDPVPAASLACNIRTGNAILCHPMHFIDLQFICLRKQYRTNKYEALRSRSLRDGSLHHKGCFATVAHSCSALRCPEKHFKTSYSKSTCLFTYNKSGSKSLFTNLFTYFCKQQQQIFISEIFKCEILNQHTCLPIITFGS